jgi:O-antigen ligase
LLNVTILDIGLTAAFVVIMILVSGAGVLQALIAIVLVAYFIYPRIMVGEVSTGGFFNGISMSNPVILTWHVAIAFALTYGVVRRRALSWENLLPVLPLVSYSIFFFTFVWIQSPPMSAGFLHLLTVSASWAVGLVLFSAVRDAPNGERVLSKWIAGVASFIALVAILQVAGFDINSNSTKMLRSAAGDRVVSTFNEPTAAGKFLFLLAIITVVWLFGRDPQKRKYSILMVAAILVVSILTQTRSNFAAVGVLVLLYSLAVNRRNLFARVAFTGIAAALVIFASLSTWDARFSEDQGLRGHTIDVATDYIASDPDTWWTGIGPNRYFEVLAPIDSWVAHGYPAHNYFLYLLVELGLFGTLVYILPFVVLTVSCVKAIRNGTQSSNIAKAWLCALPGLLLMAMFGWGLLSVVAPALFLVMGYIYASISQSRRDQFGLGGTRPRDTGAERGRADPRILLR